MNRFRKQLSMFFLPALLAAGTAYGQEFTDFSSAEQAKKWKVERGSVEIHPSGLRLRIDGGAKSNYGLVRKTVRVSKKGGWLQIEQPNIEDAFAAPFVCDHSKGGRKIGPVSRGLNTFDVNYRKGKGFALSICQFGSRNRKDVGPWADYKFVKVTDHPEGAVLASIRGKKEGEALAVGDTLDFTFYTTKGLKSLTADIVVVPGFIPYFKAELKADANGVLRGSYTVPDTLPGFTSNTKFYLGARTEAEGFVSTSVFGFPVKIQGKEKALNLAKGFVPATPMVRKTRELWEKLTTGKNLAYKKSVALIPAPTYHLNKDPNDHLDLTDGLLSERTDDRIWFERHAVGWRSTIGCMKIDLGSQQNIGRSVVRILSGANRTSPAPSSIELFISKDGEKWFKASELKKLAPGEKDQADWKTTYYLDESTDIYVYPFAMDVNAEARYVLLRITGAAGMVVSDEWALIEGKKEVPGFNAAYQTAGKAMPLKGLVAEIRAGVLAAAKDQPMAQFIQLTDLRPENAVKKTGKKKGKKKGKTQDTVSIVVEVPDGIELLPAANRQYEKTALDGNRTKYGFKIELAKKSEGPYVFLKAVKDRVEGNAAVYAVVNGQEQFRSEYPVQVVKFPEFKPFKRLHVSLAWIGEGYQIQWPDFFRVWRKLGFNWISGFPLYHKQLPDPRAMAFYEAGKKEGFKLVLNLCPLTEMRRKFGKEEGVFCKGSQQVCPSYRGKGFQLEMERLSKYIEIYKPDAFFDDNEAWTRARVVSLKCPHCVAEWKKSGKSWEEYLLSMGADYPAQVKKAVLEGAKRGNYKISLIGSYDRSPWKPTYQIDRFTDIYPASIDHSQPSLYVAGRGQLVRKIVRHNWLAQKNRRQIAFLTAGTYGEFSSEKMEIMVLESFLNGANGITYFKFSTFDTPLDFYYMSKALSMLRPYEDMIAESEFAEVKASPAEISTSAIRKGNEMLILAVNYEGCKPDCVLELPFEGKVTDLVSGDTLSANGRKLNLKVPAGKFRLIHLK